MLRMHGQKVFVKDGEREAEDMEEVFEERVCLKQIEVSKQESRIQATNHPI